MGGQRYGTSVAGVQKVGDSGRVCLMDLDVQGVENLKRRADLRAFAVWIAPPSLDALRARLRGRGTEDSGEIEKRITRATQEIEFSLSARCLTRSSSTTTSTMRMMRSRKPSRSACPEDGPLMALPAT